jgi:hypothetical protein
MPYGREQYSRHEEGIKQVVEEIESCLEELRRQFPQLFERNDLCICYYERTIGQLNNSTYPEKFRTTELSINDIQKAGERIHKAWYHRNDICQIGVHYTTDNGQIISVMAETQSIWEYRKKMDE